LDSGANIEDRDDHGHTPLHLAAEAGNMEIVRMLITHGAQVNALTIVHGTGINYTPVDAAASRGHLEVTKYLSQNGAILYEREGYMGYHSVMLGAAASGNIELVRYLHEGNEIPIDETDSMGISPLHMAIEKAHEHVVEYLVQNGANPNIKVAYTPSPIDLAREKLASLKCDDSTKERLRAILSHLEQLKESHKEAKVSPKTAKKWWHVWK
jgi:ankyrin repeat protein